MAIQTWQLAVSIPTYKRLAELKDTRTAELGRQVTYSEVLEMLLDEHAREDA
jgi:hypothetical protein